MSKRHFYTTLAPYYDRIYHFVDYRKQAEWFCRLIQRYKRSPGKSVLDVCCGTGTHAALLTKYSFAVTGLDISKEILMEARRNYPTTKFIQADMRTFSLKKKFDVILCFFNSILYNSSFCELRTTIANFANHLQPGGVVIFDTVDKGIGIHSQAQKFEYCEKDLKIEFSPRWVYVPGHRFMDLRVDFKIVEGTDIREFEDNHVMGAFSLDEISSVVRQFFPSLWLLERRFDDVAAHNGKDFRAIVLARS